jgi:hypothetical protein
MNTEKFAKLNADSRCSAVLPPKFSTLQRRKNKEVKIIVGSENYGDVWTHAFIGIGVQMWILLGLCNQNKIFFSFT